MLGLGREGGVCCSLVGAGGSVVEVCSGRGVFRSWELGEFSYSSSRKVYEGGVGVDEVPKGKMFSSNVT